MKTVIILGNGFDKNLGLSTSYLDFVESDQFNGFKQQHKLVANFLCENRGRYYWLDIEKRLGELSMNLTQHLTYKVYCDLCSALNQFLFNVDISAANQLNKHSAAYYLLKEHLLTKYTDEVDIISFNYTSTVQRIYEDLSCPNKIMLRQIHGAVEAKSEQSKNGSNLVFGIGDKVDFHPSHSFLLKSANINYNKSSEINSILIEADQIIFFGHSFGDNDKMYFESFFDECTSSNAASKPKKLVFFYHESADLPNGSNLYEINYGIWNLSNKRLGTMKLLNSVYFVSTASYCFCKGSLDSVLHGLEDLELRKQITLGGH